MCPSTCGTWSPTHILAFVFSTAIFVQSPYSQSWASSLSVSLAEESVRTGAIRRCYSIRNSLCAVVSRCKYQNHFTTFYCYYSIRLFLSKSPLRLVSTVTFPVPSFRNSYKPTVRSTASLRIVNINTFTLKSTCWLVNYISSYLTRMDDGATGESSLAARYLRLMLGRKSLLGSHCFPRKNMGAT